MTGIGAKLFGIIAVIILIFSSFLLYRTYEISNDHVNSAVATHAEMALQFDLSIRKYVEEKIRPVMFDLVGENEFIPETMSTSFVAHSIFEDVKTRFPNYVLKFSSDDPRNPANQAGPEELQIIRYFNENPNQEQWSGNIIINDTEYFAKFKARRMKESCLHCHGKPGDAPKSLLDRYGSEAGFNRPVGEVIALDTVAIPTMRIREVLWEELTNNFIIIGFGLLLLFIALFVSVKMLITNRLVNITRHFAEASAQKASIRIESIHEGARQDEITSLARSYNSLARKLNNYHDSLDQEIRERKRIEEQLRLSNTTLENVLESTSPLCITNTDYELILANKAYYDIWPKSEESSEPQKCYTSRPGSLCKTESCLLRQIVSGRDELVRDVIKYKPDGDKQVFLVTARPFRDSEGKLIGIVESFQDITQRKKLEDEKANLIEKLQNSLEKVKLLSGFLPICSSCKKIRDDKGYWKQIEWYIREHSEAEFSHSICPECEKDFYHELDAFLLEKKQKKGTGEDG